MSGLLKPRKTYRKKKKPLIAGIVSQECSDYLHRLADNQRRSISNVVGIIIENWVEEHKKHGGGSLVESTKL